MADPSAQRTKQIRALIVVATLVLAFVLGAGWNEMVSPFVVVAVCAVGIALAWWMAGTGVVKPADRSGVPAGFSEADPRILMSAGPDGIREAMRASYEKHYQIALREPPSVDNSPHASGLYGALGTRYLVTGKLTDKLSLMAEVAPFLSMNEAEGQQMLTEYVVYQEQPQGAHVDQLRAALNSVVSLLIRQQTDTFRAGMLYCVVNGLLNNVRWAELLNTSSREAILREAEAFARRMQGKA